MDENVKSSQGENEEEKKQEEIREVEEETKLQLFAQTLITEISISPQKYINDEEMPYTVTMNIPAPVKIEWDYDIKACLPLEHVSEIPDLPL